MSAFLGPVHHWMYRKIQILWELTDRLLTFSTDAAFAERLDEFYGPEDKQPLEAVIDQSNIHGWLSGHVQRAEERFADVVEDLLEREGVSLEKLKDIACTFGRNYAVPNDTGVADAYHMMDRVLLDGMPCDGGRKVVSEDEEELVFQYDPELHALSRRCEKGAAYFAALREAVLDGMLESAALKLEPLGGGTYRLSREV